MDALDRVHPEAAELFAAVDGVLRAAGAPADHPVTGLLRRTRALPGQALATVAALRTGPPAEAADRLRAAARAYGGTRTGLPDPVRPDGPLAVGERSWTGPAASAYRDRWADLSASLDAAADGLASTGAFADAVTAWIGRTRQEVAWAAAAAMGSAEAVALRVSSGGVRAAVAAADLGAHLLEPVVAAYESGAELSREWAGRI